jgi:NTF2-related export protein 1/2
VELKCQCKHAIFSQTFLLAAETFVNHYYQAVNNQSNLLPFYVNSSSRYSIAADISINGSVVAQPSDYSALLEAQGQGVRYEIESLDAHVVNPSSQYGAPDNIHDNNKVEKSGSRMSIVVTTMGRVQFGKGRDAPQKMFNETFVLVPNWDSMARNPPRGLGRWLIMSQNFRAL